MNYPIPFPLGIPSENINNKLIEEELFQIRKNLTLLEERINKLEKKENRKEIPKYMNSEINKNDGFYMI